MDRQTRDLLGWWERRPSSYRPHPSEGRETPAMDVKEQNDKFIFTADLPGVKKEDLDVSITGDILTIKAERKSDGEVCEEYYHLSERSCGSFLRSMALPPTCDAENIEATYENGVLKIALPKSAQSEIKKITVA